MKPRQLLPLLASLLITGVCAQNPDEARAEAGKLIDKAQRAKAEGRTDEAGELLRKAKALQSDHRDGEVSKAERAKREAVMREIEELHRAGKIEEAEHLKRKIAESGGGPIAGARERLMHISQAIEHIRAAGLGGEAEHLEQVARQMKEELARSGQKSVAEPVGPERQHIAMREMHEGLEQFRGQMQKMARAIEELRDQIRALQGEDGKKKGLDQR